MVTLFEIIHYFYGLIIVFFLLWCLIKIHNYFAFDKLDLIQNNKVS